MAGPPDMEGDLEHVDVDRDDAVTASASVPFWTDPLECDPLRAQPELAWQAADQLSCCFAPDATPPVGLTRAWQRSTASPTL
jgi:hypothetical protein